jgi:hypothetical protein
MRIASWKPPFITAVYQQHRIARVCCEHYHQSSAISHKQSRHHGLVLGRHNFVLSSATPGTERQHIEHTSSIMSDASEDHAAITDGTRSNRTK